MISEKQIKQLVEEKLAGSNKFIVDLKIKPANKIEILLDSFDKIAIKDCVEVSRHVESNLDREKEDFELMVSSAVLEEPFKVTEQYKKNIGKEVAVITTEGIKISGKLVNFENDGIELEIKKTEGTGKNKQIILENLKLSFNQIKETKIIFSFK